MLRIKELRIRADKAQKDVARDLGVPPSTLSTWENGIYQPDIEMLHKLAEYYNVSIDYLLGRDLIDHESVKGDGVLIPVMGCVPAGVPFEAVENIVGYVSIPPEWANKGGYAALQIKGDSMEPKISDGDAVIIKEQTDAESGDIVIAYVNGYEATCKKLRKTEKGLYLVPLNSAYDSTFYSNEEVKKTPVKIMGVVVNISWRGTY
jgi:repressor LexA